MSSAKPRRPLSAPPSDQVSQEWLAKKKSKMAAQRVAEQQRKLSATKDAQAKKLDSAAVVDRWHGAKAAEDAARAGRAKQRRAQEQRAAQEKAATKEAAREEYAAWKQRKSRKEKAFTTTIKPARDKERQEAEAEAVRRRRERLAYQLLRNKQRAGEIVQAAAEDTPLDEDLLAKVLLLACPVNSPPKVRGGNAGSTKNPDKRPSCDTHSVPAGARDAAPGALADVSAAQHTSADTPAGTHSDGPVHTDDATADADAALAVGYADLTMDFPTFSDDDDGDGGASQAAQASQDGPALGHDRIRSATLADDTEVPDAAYSDTQPPGADGGDNADTPTPGPEAATHAPSNGLSLDDEAVPQNGTAPDWPDGVAELPESGSHPGAESTSDQGAGAEAEASSDGDANPGPHAAAGPHDDWTLITEGGETYYYNTVTHEAAWELPAPEGDGLLGEGEGTGAGDGDGEGHAPVDDGGYTNEPGDDWHVDDVGPVHDATVDHPDAAVDYEHVGDDGSGGGGYDVHGGHVDGADAEPHADGSLDAPPLSSTSRYHHIRRVSEVAENVGENDS